MELFLVALIILLSGSLLALITRTPRSASIVGISTTVIAAALVCYATLPVLLGEAELSIILPWSIPGGEFSLLIDPLAAFFILPIALLSLFCALYAGPYMKHDGHKRSLAPHWFLFNIMVGAMLVVVSAANALLLLAAWEIMTLSSFFLVAWDHRQEEVRKAAWLYLLVAHMGMVLLLTLFILASSYCTSLNFRDFSPLAQLSIGRASVLYLLALFGFGVKAGLFPVHIWLPNAHPAAPSHVSALMSGVLIKTGIYGILRIITLLPPAPMWWGWLMAILGGTGALYGISMAAQQRDIKRCLAYSTIENVGIIFLGLGFGIVANAQGHPTIALLAYAGGLLHLWNHALFKGVMFLGAGALMHATGTRDMNLMGGLLRRLPLASILWIGGSLAIGALPPFNGIISEWLIYLSLGNAGLNLHSSDAIIPLLLFGLLGLIGALALLTFSRLIGICLLGQPRTDAAKNAHEAPPMMLFSMGTLLSGCLAIGLFPAYAVQLLSTTIAQISHQPVNASINISKMVTPLGDSALLLLACLAILIISFLWLRRHRLCATSTTWGCGYHYPSARMEYTGEGYAETALHHLLPKAMRPLITGGTVTGTTPPPTAIEQTSDDPVLALGLQPLCIWLADRFQRLRWLQQGQLPIYLFYIFLASAILMVWSLWAGRHTGG